MADNFEEWHDAARQYAAEHPELGLWPFQIEAMASDWAWRMEGAEITAESRESAYQDWISGNNPYSVHTVHLDGYDQRGNWDRLKKKCREDYTVFWLCHADFKQDMNRFIDSISIELYFDEEKAWRQFREWMSGENPKSPHHVPFDATNSAERAARRQELHARYPEEMKEDTFWFLYEHKLLDQQPRWEAVQKRVEELLKEDCKPALVKRIRHK